MKQIKFDDATFNLATDVSASIDAFCASVLREEGVTVEAVDAAADNVEVISILEDGEVTDIFRVYHTVSDIRLQKNVEVDRQGTIVDVIQVFMRNTNLQNQIEQLSDGLSQVASTQSTQASTINTLTEEVGSKVDSSVIGNAETIDGPATRSFKVGETFMGNDGKYYEITAPVMTGAILVVGGNCTETNVAAVLSAE